MKEILADRLVRASVEDRARPDRDAWCAEHVYKATIRRFANGVEVSVRDVGAERIRRCRAVSDVPIWLQMPKERTAEEQARRDEENAHRAAHRAKQKVRWDLKSMQADHLLTLTYRENMLDLDRLKKHWKEFVRLMRKKYSKWQYVCCREPQERGAWHLHIGMRGRGDVHWMRRCWWMALGHRVEIDYSPEGKKSLRALVKDGEEWRYARSEEVAGNIDIRGPSKRWGGQQGKWSTEKLAAYMTKYMAKAFDKIDSGRRYWPSRDIVRAVVDKIWLLAQDWRTAVHEVHDRIRNLYSCRSMHIWAVEEKERLWFSGSDVECPF